MISRSQIARGLLAAALLCGSAAIGVYTSASPAAAAGVTAQTCNSTPTYAGGGWLAFRPAGLGSIVAQTSVTYAPDRIYATDGKAVSRTDDGGCIWTTLPLPATPLVDAAPLPVPLPVAVPSGTPRINALAAPSTTTSARFVYLATALDIPQADTSGLPAPLNTLHDPATQPYVYASANGGASFTASHQGLPTLGSVDDIASSPTSPNLVYASVTDDVGGKSGVYRSSDFGATWTLMNSGGSTPSTGTLKVNPAVSTTVYGKFSDGVRVSLDSGATWTPINHTGSTAAYDVAPGAGYIQLVQGYSDRNEWARSTDGGAHFVSHLAPVKPTSVAASALVDATLLGSDAGDWVEVAKDGRYVSVAVTPSAGPLTDVSMAAPVIGSLSASGIITANETGEALVARLIIGVYGTPRFEIQLTPVTLLPHGAVKQFPSSLYPFTDAEHLGPGQRKDVPYQLLLPRTPTPVDLMFLVDTTSSTDDTLSGVRQSLAKIADQLAAIGLDVQFGVADFRDYPPDDYGNGESTDYPYKLRRVIGPYNDSLAQAINKLTPAGGGDLDEAALTALYQSTLGVGQRMTDVNGHVVQVIPAGGEARYRNGSLRLAVMATDAAYHKEPDYPTPSWAKTVQALLSQKVHQIGLAVQTMNSGEPTGFDSYSDELKMARQSGALAPVGGVDCNGDGTVDIPAGQPLVCRVPHPPVQKNVAPGVLPDPAPTPLPLAAPIAELAANIPDLSAVRLTVKGAPPGVAAVVGGKAGGPTVNLHTDNTLGYTIRYTCPVAIKTQSWKLSIEAYAGIRPLTSSAATLVCDPSAKPAPAPLELLPAVAAAVAPVAPPQPPAQGTSNANPNPAVNANAGFAQQEDQERQLAFADADNGLEAAPDETLAMSTPTNRNDPAGMFIAGAMGLTMTAGATVYARRQRMQTQCARVGTWR